MKYFTLHSDSTIRSRENGSTRWCLANQNTIIVDNSALVTEQLRDFIDTYQNEGADMAYLMFCPGLQSEVQKALSNMIKSVCTSCVMSRNDDNS